MSNSLQVLADNRDALLLAEVAAWLHMFGKFHEEFLKGDHNLDIKIPEDVRKDFPLLTSLLEDTWPSDIWADLDLVIPEFQTHGLSILSLIENHRNSMRELYEHNASGLLRLMIDAHGRGSSTEKGVLVRFALEQKEKVYPSTSLGDEAPSYIDLIEIQNDRKRFYHFLQTQLNHLKGNKARLSQMDWSYLRQKFIQEIKQYFRISVAETRRPLNDVTLFDQTVASVAFFKAALAQNLLQGWKEPYTEKVVEKYRWRLLRIGLNGFAFWGKSMRIGDLLARKELVDKALDKIQTAFEVTYPLGFETYRDENGSVLIVPDIENLHQENHVDGIRSIEGYIQETAYNAFSNEATFTLSLSDSMRGMLSFGRLVTESLPQPKPNMYWLQQEWQDRKQTRDICPVCNLRPQGPSLKALSRKVCMVCEERRLNSSERWIQNFSKTIWIDEVADTNGRFALVVAQFGMADWLSGIDFNTVLAFDSKSRPMNDPEREGGRKLYDFDLPKLIANIQEGLRRDTTAFNNNNLLGLLVLNDSRDRFSNTVRAFYNTRILDTDLQSVSSLSDPERLALEMIRLSPSFSRIRRVWETTQTFWENVVSDFNKPDAVGEIACRLQIEATYKPKTAGRETLGISHAYELKLGNINLSIVCISQDKYFTVDNLRRAAFLLGASVAEYENDGQAAKYVQRYLDGKTFDIEDPSGYSGSNEPLGRLSITNVATESTSYPPAISILKEPRTFMALVPADKALQVAEAIKEKYEREMGKVRNRLPLTVGVVFAGARTPLPAILDAGRRMLDQPTEATHWQVKGVDLSLYPEKVLLKLGPGEGGEPSLTLDIPTIMGDEETEDVWFPYWCLEEETANASERKRKFKGIDGKYWTHVSDLQVGDIVSFTPSRLDFEFLDTAARRFEISYDNGKRRGFQHLARPYYLEQLDEFEKLWTILSQGLETTQIHNLIGIIEDKRMEWLANRNDLTFKQVVSDALNNANWRAHTRPDPEQFKQLSRAAASGQLADVVELYMQILKRPEADKSQTEIAKTGASS